MKRMTVNLTKTLSVLLMSCAFFAGCNEIPDNAEVLPTDWSEGVRTTDAWIMAGTGTSGSNSSDTLHIGYSVDGLTWTALKNNEGIFTSRLGTGHIRDPYIFRMNDGSFVLLASDYTADGAADTIGADLDVEYDNNPSTRIYVAFSDDLINWDYELLLKVKNSTGQTGCRYPRAVYNKNQRCYEIYFTSDDGDGVQAIYAVQTIDFRTVKEGSLVKIFRPAHSVGQGQVVTSGSDYYIFCYDGRQNNGLNMSTTLGRDIQCAKLDSEWRTKGFKFFGTDKDYYINRVEGQDIIRNESEPCVYQRADGEWIMLTNDDLNTTKKGSWKAYKTSTIDDTSSWVEVETDYIKKYEGEQRILGTSVTRITASELDALKSAF